MMSPNARRQIRADLELIERFAHSYRERFATAIEQLNHAPTPQTGDQCLRLCVETVHMILSVQDTLATALRRLEGEGAR